MSGRRIVVTGLGGELGSLVGTLLEEQSWVGNIVGLDTNPPRRRLKRSVFHLVDASDRRSIMQIIADADPHVIVHIG
ncbi:MAG: NAD-dependent epimerase/dehydratase family protein, partial [Ilumatobacteraceae bacterium]